MRPSPAVALLAILALTGCHSRYIAATITNRTPGTLSPVELDYPSASFGADTLAPGATYAYRFKIIGSGPTAVLWTDAAHRDHKAAGPQLHEGDEGSLSVTIDSGNTPAWNLRLIHRGS
jgi:hypothetical protein